MKRRIFVSEDVLDLVPAYLEVRHKYVPALAAAAERNDFSAVTLIAHKLQGVAASYGFADLATIGVSLGSAAEARQAAQVHIQVKRMQKYLDSIEVK